MADERIFLNEGNTYVSNTKIAMGGTTYATANITSVSKGRTAPSTGCAVLLVILGVFGALGSLVIMSEDVGTGFGALFGALLIGGLGVLWYRSLKADYHVLLRSASGESRGLTSKNEKYIDQVGGAITEAITHRG
jgi:uncharacterized protein DUF6232